MRVINTKQAPTAIGPYSQAISVEKTLYTSGQLGVNPETNQLVSNDLQDQTKQIFKNLDSILNAANYKKEDVCKVTIYLKDLTNFNEVNALYGIYFGNHKPSRSTIEVSRLPKDGLILIDMIAHKS